MFNIVNVCISIYLWFLCYSSLYGTVRRRSIVIRDTIQTFLVLTSQIGIGTIPIHLGPGNGNCHGGLPANDRGFGFTELAITVGVGRIGGSGGHGEQKLIGHGIVGLNGNQKKRKRICKTKTKNKTGKTREMNRRQKRKVLRNDWELNEVIVNFYAFFNVLSTLIAVWTIFVHSASNVDNGCPHF